MSSNSKPNGEFSRRELIEKVGAFLGGAVLVSHSSVIEAIARMGNAPVVSVLSPVEVALLDEIADTILPETNTPGAKEAGVGPFMALMVSDAYSPERQKIFRNGLAALERDCLEMNGHGFQESTPEERLRLLERLDREQFDQMKNADESQPVHYFRMVKELALLGYFTSEIGYMKAMRYEETPGRFEPCVPYLPGEKAWAPHA